VQTSEKAAPRSAVTRGVMTLRRYLGSARCARAICRPREAVAPMIRTSQTSRHWVSHLNCRPPRYRRVMKRSAVGPSIGLRWSGAVDRRRLPPGPRCASRRWPVVDPRYAGVRQFWSDHGTDQTSTRSAHIANADRELRALHAHSRQAIADDIVDASPPTVQRTRGTRRARAPWRDKSYRR